MSHAPYYSCHGSIPCLQCYPHSYIRMVQHLIERCLLLRMNRDDCVKALARHASIRPLVTLTVWKELIKVNENFFQTYFHSLSPRAFNNCRLAQRLMPGNRSMVVKKNNPNKLSHKRIYY